MRSFVYSALSLLAVTGAHAAPSAPAAYEPRGSSCMPYNTGVALANAFKDLIGETFNKTLAIEAMIPSFQDYSDSVSELINNGCPSGPATLGDPSFSSRAAFIKGQSSQKPIPFQILQIWPACDSVTLRWRSSAPGTVQPEEIVTGIIVLETVPNQNPNGAFDWKIKTTYSEFNSGAWLYDIGAFVPTNCTSTAS